MSICRNLALSTRYVYTCPVRLISTSSLCYFRKRIKPRNIRSGVFKRSQLGDTPITYEESQPPENIGVTKSWISWNTSSLHEEDRAAETVVEDNLIRNFITGTFPNLMASEVIIKRRHNIIVLSFLLFRVVKPQKYYFLFGYTEELLSCLLKCPVKVEVQTVETDKEITFRYI